MKLSLFNTKIGSLSSAVVAAASIACIGIAQQADAGVTWLVSESGADLRLITDGGSLSVSQADGGGAALDTYGLVGANATAIMVNTTVFGVDSWHQDLGSGATSGDNPWLLGRVDTTVFAGDTFMFFNADLYWDGTFGSDPGAITPVSSLTFQALDIATAFGENLDSGPVVLWTHGETGDTISIDLASNVPEPSSTLLLGLGGLTLILCRRRG